MKAWKHVVTKKLIDIQTIPNPLPAEFDPAEWELSDVTEGELTALNLVANYTHSQRGLQGLIVDTTDTITYNLEDIL